MDIKIQFTKKARQENNLPDTMDLKGIAVQVQPFGVCVYPHFTQKDTDNPDVDIYPWYMVSSLSIREDDKEKEERRKVVEMEEARKRGQN